MSIRVRCTGCSKKVSVDDAFAGGACRCPYCKEIVLVGGALPEAGGSRPYAPVERPETPDEVRPEAPGAFSSRLALVPMANPVRVQGVLTFVLVGLIAVLAAVAVWLGVYLSHPGGGDANSATNPAPGVSPLPAPGPAPAPGPGEPGGPHVQPPPATGPVTTGPAAFAPHPAGPGVEGGGVAGVPITAPVIYILDGGGSMKYVYDYARYMTRASILSLGAEGKFQLAVAGEDAVRWLGEGYRAGGKGADAAVKEFLEPSAVGGADVGKALEAAIAKAPRTVVLLRRDAVARAAELAAKAKAAGVKIVAVGLGSDAAARASFEQLTGPTGGRCETFSESALEAWVAKAPPLD